MQLLGDGGEDILGDSGPTSTMIDPTRGKYTPTSVMIDPHRGSISVEVLLCSWDLVRKIQNPSPSMKPPPPPPPCIIRLSKEVSVYSKQIEPAQLAVESSRLSSPEKQASAEGSGPTVSFPGPLVVPRSPSCSETNRRLVILFWAGV